MSILLEDKEINDLDNALVFIPEWINETDEYKSFLFSRRYFAKAQAKKIHEWGNEHDPCATNVVKSKRECFTCWQALLKEIE